MQRRPAGRLCRSKEPGGDTEADLPVGVGGAPIIRRTDAVGVDQRGQTGIGMIEQLLQGPEVADHAFAVRMPDWWQPLVGQEVELGFNIEEPGIKCLAA